MNQKKFKVLILDTIPKISLSKAAYDFKISVSDGIVYAKDSDGNTIKSQPSGPDDQIINHVFSLLPNGGTVVFGKGNYIIAADVVQTENISVIGAGYDNIQSTSYYATRFRHDNKARWLVTGKMAHIDKVQFDAAKSTASDLLLIKASYIHIGSIWVWGAKEGQNAVHFQGAKDAYLTNCKVDQLLIQQGGGSTDTAALYLEYTTQSEFAEVMSTAATNNAVILDNSDNNHFDKLQITNMRGVNGKLLVLGTSQTSASYGQRIDFLATSSPSGFTAIVVNFPIPSPDDVTNIGSWDIEGGAGASVIFNNNSHGALVAYLATQSKRGWNISTPSLPHRTGAEGAVQNQFPHSVQIFQSGMIGTHIIDLNGRDNSLGLDPTTIILEPGEKIYYATAVPKVWKWKVH